MRKRDIAAKVVAKNWRIRRRLPRITALAYKMGLISELEYKLIKE